uniref:long neurotoxin OH-34-like n=1 Tax=Myxine glutinosa TaxID=7769 RepID=UPI00358F8A5F
MSVLPFVVLIGILGAAAELKCYVGVPGVNTELTCPGSEPACGTATSSILFSSTTALSCATKTICDLPTPGFEIECCYTDLCNSTGNLASSNILIILTLSLSMMLNYIM